MCFTWKTSLIWLFPLNSLHFLPFRPRRHHARQPPGKPCYGNGFSMVLRAAGCASGWKSIFFMNFHEVPCFSCKIRKFSVFCRKQENSNSLRFRASPPLLLRNLINAMPFHVFQASIYTPFQENVKSVEKCKKS